MNPVTHCWISRPDWPFHTPFLWFVGLMKKLPVLQSSLPPLSEVCNPWQTSDCSWLYHWHPEEARAVGNSLDCTRLSSFSVTTLTGVSASHLSRECVRSANGCLCSFLRTAAYFFHPLSFLSCAGCYMGRRPRCLTQLQSLLMWWVFPCLSAEPSSDSARAPWASGEDFSSCRHLLLQASILGCYWLPSLLCMPVKEFLAVGCGSTVGCVWNQLSGSFSTFPMLCSSLTASCSSATCHTKWGTECFSCLHGLGSWQLCLLTGLSPKLWKYKNSPTTFLVLEN